MLVCKECGSEKVQVSVWVDANTNKYIGEGMDAGRSENWCENCNEHVSLINKKDYWKISDSYWFRHFLICNKLASSINGFETMNFLKLIRQSNEEERYGNDHMNKYFYSINAKLCDMTGNDPKDWTDIAFKKEWDRLTPEELDSYYRDYCQGKIKITKI